MVEDLNETSHKAVKIGQKYIDASQRYIELKIFQQLAMTISLVGKIMVVGSFVFIAFLLLFLSMSLSLGEWLDNTVLGYLAAAGISILLAVITFLFRKHINTLVISKLSKSFKL